MKALLNPPPRLSPRRRGRLVIQYYSILFNRVLRPDYGDAIPEPILDAFLQPDIEFPPFAPAEIGGRPRARGEELSWL